MLWGSVAGNTTDKQEQIVQAWDWVANEIQYKNLIAAHITVEGRSAGSSDYWQISGHVFQNQSR